MVAVRLGYISKCIKRKTRQVVTTKSIDAIAFAAISLAPSNLDADSVAPAGRPFGQCCWPPDWRATMRIDEGDRWLLIEPSITTIAKEQPSQLTDYCDGYSIVRCSRLFEERASILAPRSSLLSPLVSLLSNHKLK